MILCLGTTPAVQRSMTFAHLRANEVNRTGVVQQYASGKSINAARVLITLGHAVTCLGFSGGHTGQFLLKDLDDAGIPHRFVEVDPSTRVCTTLIDQSAGSATELIEESRALAAEDYLLLMRTYLELLPEATGVLLSGSLPPGAPADFYADCVRSANQLQKKVILDAAGEPLLRALDVQPTVVKPNRDELRQTVDRPVETDLQLKSAMIQLLAMGPKWAVVTNGAKETWVSDGTRFWTLLSPEVAVVSAIGSGDSFAAGLMAGIASGRSVPEACRLAVACGAANAMTPMAGHLENSTVRELERATAVCSVDAA